jgi:TonB family protein
VISKIAFLILLSSALIFAQSPVGQTGTNQTGASQTTATVASRPTYPLEPITISNPRYPASAISRKIEGKVTAEILISETGDVENVQVFKADEALAQAVTDAAKTWKFKPVVKDSTPVAAISVVKCNFSLHDGQPDDVVPNISPATEFPKSVRVSDSVMRAMVL